MNADEYQKKAHGFATYGNNAMYPALGLCEEAGEVAGKIAKFVRKHVGEAPKTVGMSYEGIVDAEDNVDFCSALKKELGDVCWMVAELCTVYGLGLGDVMAANIEKLTDRQKRNVIVGEGDNR